MSENTISSSESNVENIYKLEGKVPFTTAFSIGLQHVLAMFLANVTPIIILCGVAKINGNPMSDALKTQLLQNSMLVAGIASLIQIVGVGKIGSRLPIIMGISFTFLSVALAHTGKDYNIILGAIIVGGIIEGLLGLTYKYWKRIISPIVASCVVIGIGLSLLPVGAVSFCGGTEILNTKPTDFGSIKCWIIGTITLMSCTIALHTIKSTLKALAPLIGLIIGYIVSIPLGMIDVSHIMSNGVLSFPVLFPTGKPIFELNSIISFVFIFLVSATETIGDTSAICHGALDRDMTEKECAGSLACDGFASSFAALFGCSAITSFSQNVGLTNLTKVVNRFVVATGAFILIIASLFPPIAELLKTVPQPVLGGCTILMFGQILISGIQMLNRAGLTERNITIASISICLSVGFSSQPLMFQAMPQLIKEIFVNNPVSIIFVVALFLDLCLPNAHSI